MLQHPDHDQPFKLEVDASQYVLGAILYQRNDGGKLQAVGYYLQTLNLAECHGSKGPWLEVSFLKFLSRVSHNHVTTFWSMLT